MGCLTLCWTHSAVGSAPKFFLDPSETRDFTQSFPLTSLIYNVHLGLPFISCPHELTRDAGALGMKQKPLYGEQM